MLTLRFIDFWFGKDEGNGEYYHLYVLKNAEEVLYVGISNYVWGRWFGSFNSHMGIGGWPPSTAGRTVKSSLPDSLYWTMELYTLEDCRKFLIKETKIKWQKRLFDIETAEVWMIKILKPKLNVMHNY